MTQTIEQLTARVAELEAEVERTNDAFEQEHKACHDLIEKVIPNINKQLAAAQLREKVLTDALNDVGRALDAKFYIGDFKAMKAIGEIVSEALSTSADTSALDAYVAEKVNKIESCRDWYKRRIDLLQEWQSKMRDPERTIVCDIIANGLTMPEGGRYEIGKSDLSTITKQRDLAVEALENCRLLAARHRKEEWAGHIMRFCKDAGLSGSPIRNDSIKESENNKAS